MDSRSFTKREQDVVSFLLQGKSNKQIALALGISNRTVEFHLSNIYVKLGVTSRTEAILKLAESRPWESTGAPAGEIQVKSTVEETGATTENGFKSILRRIAMKKTYYALGGIVLIAAILVVMIVTNRPAPSRGFAPIDSIPTIPGKQTPTIAPAPPTATPLIPTVPPPPTDVVLPSHTVNGYTATIESYYVDISHITFQVRLSGGGINFGDEHFYDRIGSPDLYDENGNLINTSGGWGPAIDPALLQFEFVPVTLLRGDHIKGQLAFDINNAPEYSQTLAQFRFDFDLPIYPTLIFHPKQAITANGVEMLLDQVTVTPTFTQIYLCYPSPTFADWLIDSESLLQLDGLKTTPYNFSVPFDSAIGGDRRAGSEPYWVSPVKNGRCLKSGFAVGSTNPTSLTLTIPQLARSDPDLLLSDQLVIDYPDMSPKQAYHKYLEEHDNIVKGPWVFNVELIP